MRTKATAIAHSNIGLVKYWGKRDELLKLPDTGSIGITVSKLRVTTTARLLGRRQQDRVYLNGIDATGDPAITSFIQYVRARYELRHGLQIVSLSTFPLAAGLASSAAGFAALAKAISDLLGLNYDDRRISELARLGSGSAARSVFGGFVEWRRGKRSDGSDSIGHPINSVHPNLSSLRLLTCLTSFERKAVASGNAMRVTKERSPFYEAWCRETHASLSMMRAAIHSGNFEELGRLAEQSCFQMHATMLGASASLLYWNNATIEIMNEIHKLRDEGISCFMTIDAGPHVKVLCLKEDVRLLRHRLARYTRGHHILVSEPTDGVTRSYDHLC